MRVSHFSPGPALEPFVRGYEVVEAVAATERTLVPESGLVIGFRYAGAARLIDGGAGCAVPDASVTGLRVAARRMLTSAGGGVVLVKFRETGAAPFLEGPLQGLFGRTSALDAVVPSPEVAVAADEVRGAETVELRVAAVERFLLRRARRRTWRPDAVVEATVRAVLADPGAMRVAAQAGALGLSIDALEKRFRRIVGASPKQLAAIVRLRRALALHPRLATLGELAAEAGYYDQAHFNRQLRAMLGASPGAFLSRVEHCME